MIFLYLVAIIAANLSVSTFGANASIINAFLFIGLDLTARDALHDRWHGVHLWRNMALLILTGSILSAVLNVHALRIAVASCVAFGSAGLVDAIAYHVLGDRTRFLRVNGSNVLSAAVDSVVFPALAFGLPLLVGVMVGQFVAKVFGGFIWSLVLTHAPVRQQIPA